MIEAGREEAVHYPVGDAARRLREWGHTLNDYSAWEERARATFICHVPDPGEPDETYWFGFDCSHAGDYSPALDGRYGHNKIGSATGWGTTVQYRDQAYVERECVSLAQQLRALQMKALPAPVP